MLSQKGLSGFALPTRWPLGRVVAPFQALVSSSIESVTYAQLFGDDQRGQCSSAERLAQCLAPSGHRLTTPSFCLASGSGCGHVPAEHCGPLLCLQAWEAVTRPPPVVSLTFVSSPPGP